MITLPPTPESPPQLAYMQRPRLAFVARHRKTLIFVALCIAISTPLYRYWQPLKHRILWIYWSRAAAAHVMPPIAIDIFINDINKLNAVDRAAFVPSTFYGSFHQYAPSTYQSLTAYDARVKAPISSNDPVAFMGTLRRPDGTPRLVLITAGVGPEDDLLKEVLVVVLPQAGFFSQPPPSTSARVGKAMAYRPPNVPLSRIAGFKTGVRNAADPSHVIFEFNIFKDTALPLPSRPKTVYTTGIIDAYLQDDDSIFFELRPVDAAPRARLQDSRIPGDLVR